MRTFQTALLLIAACHVHCENSDVHSLDNLGRPSEDTLESSEKSFVSEAIQNISESNSTLPSSGTLKDRILNSLENSTEHNSTSAVQNSTASSYLNQKQEIGNIISKEFKPFLMFPKLPFLFPERESEYNNANGLKAHGDKLNEPKPFVFFKFSVNIRQIPLGNNSENFNNSKIINLKKLNSNEFPKENLNKNSKNEGRKRRNAKSNKESVEFFKDLPLFSPGDIDDFFPKPEFLFPDLFSRRKASKKLSRKKRDMKKPSLKNDLKFFFDIFDEAFAKTKRDLELTNPILEFFRDGNEVKNQKGNDILNALSMDNFPYKILNSKRISREKGFAEQEAVPHITDFFKRAEYEKPMILVDKIVKIGEVDFPHTRMDGSEKLKSIRKKRKEKNDLRRRSLRNGDALKSENRLQQSLTHPRNGPEFFQPDLPKEASEKILSIVTIPKAEDREQVQVSSHEKKIISNATGNEIDSGTNVTEVADDRERFYNEKKSEVNHFVRRVVNSTENILNFAGDLIKMMDSMETQMKDKMPYFNKNKKESEEGANVTSEGENLKRKPNYDDVEKNITKILNQFMIFFKNIDSGKFDSNKSESSDWTENETLQNSKMVNGKRSKKNADFTEEYVEREKERQVADLNFLFLTVTLPTIIISALLLLVCFFSLQVRGKICTKLFKPRRVLVVEDETPSSSRK